MQMVHAKLGCHIVVVFPENLSRHGYDIIVSSIVHCVSMYQHNYMYMYVVMLESYMLQ